MRGAATSPDLRVVPATEASWGDLQAIFGTRGDPSRCFCQRYKMAPGESWASVGAEELVVERKYEGQSQHRSSRARPVSRARASWWQPCSSALDT